MMRWITVRERSGEWFSRRSLHMFAVRTGCRASAAALLASAFLLPLLSLAGLVHGGLLDMVSVAVLVAGLTGLVSGAMALRTGRTIERLTRSNARFERLSRLDPLTGLLNRRAFSEALSSAPAGSSLVIIDVDSFKAINDTHGHAVGDQVISRVASIIVDVMGKSVPAARLGGEEFGLLLTAGEAESRVAAVEALRLQIEQERFRGEDGVFRVTISAGMSETSAGKDLALAYAAADKALYLAKASGRNRVVHGAAGLTVILDLVAAGMDMAEAGDIKDNRGAA